MRKLLSFLILSGCFLMGQEVGSWRIDTADGGISIYYKGRRIVDKITLNGFSPDYKKSTFPMTNGAMESKDRVFTWRKENENARAAVSINFGQKDFELEMDVSAKPVGPFEFGVYLPSKSFQSESGYLYCQADKRNIEINETAINQIGCSKLSFEFEEQRHTIEKIMPMDSIFFVMQDHRQKDNGNFRWITSFNGGVNEEKTYKVKVKWTVEEFDPKAAAERRARMKAPVTVTIPYKVENAGFEKGLNSWDHGKKAVIDNEVFKEGKQSARLTVDDPNSDNVYITRLIPIQSGAWYSAECMVKAAGVMPAPGKMSSVGAGLIMEWADKDGKWLNAGAYACDVFGDTGWVSKRIDGIRAPVDAGYASIFLALRGKGTAWFDDFKLTRKERVVEKLFPVLGEAVNTNAPSFEWIFVEGVDEFQVELSMDPAFPQDKTLVYKVQAGNKLTLINPLEQGRWYWRVLASGIFDKQPWFFEQKVPKDRDCIPPVVDAGHARVLTPDAPVSIKVSDNSGRQPKLEIKGPDEQGYKLTDKGEGTYSITAVNGWKQGLNTLTIHAGDDMGNVSPCSLWVLYAPKPEKTIVIDKDGHYSENGKVIFPLGIYEVAPAYMDSVRKDGFEVVHTYKWESSQNDEEALKYLDACHANGLRAFIGFDRGRGSGKGIVQGNFEHIAKRVGALSSHPALFCWYLFDEPEVHSQYVPPQLLTRFAELIRKLDPYHPVVMTTWGNGMNKYRKTWDTHWTQSYRKPAVVVETINSHRKLLLNDSPITLLIHCYDQNQSKLKKAKLPVDFSKFEPDFDWMRAAAFAGITKEVNGLWWWWYAKQNGEFLTAAQVPEAWENMRKVVAEVRAIRPVLVAEGKTQGGTVVNNGCKVEWWAKTVNGRNTIIIVNTGEKDVDVEIKPEGIEAVKVKLGRFGVKVIN